MIALLIPIIWKGTGYHLLVSDILEVEEITLVLIWIVVEVICRVTCLGKEAWLTWHRWSVRWRSLRRIIGLHSLPLIFQLLHLTKDFVQQLLTFIFSFSCLNNIHGALTVHKVCGTYNMHSNYWNTYLVFQKFHSLCHASTTWSYSGCISAYQALTSPGAAC